MDRIIRRGGKKSFTKIFRDDYIIRDEMKKEKEKWKEEVILRNS